MRIPFLEGERVYLRALVPEDAQGAYPTWFNDAEVCQGNSHHYYPYTVRETEAYIERAQSFRDELVLAIVPKETGQHIGNITLKRIDYIARTAEYAIIIGDKSTWGKGFAKEASRLLLDHAFYSLNLNRVYCGTFETNIAMQRLAEFMAMKEEGRRRQAVFKDNRLLDIIEYGVLRREYMERFGTGTEE